ncbi:hypothetical protein OUZ56_002175 [Daphnia magna]|uniref:Uncharacterized protein n=1 Tax=Daphnia magna TaxID=35525 RepID=A0ABR0A4W0_9CRUS|nr:hypothetical protein OUZ56_002175 [Daphnia magna]
MGGGKVRTVVHPRRFLGQGFVIGTFKVLTFIPLWATQYVETRWFFPQGETHKAKNIFPTGENLETSKVAIQYGIPCGYRRRRLQQHMGPKRSNNRNRLTANPVERDKLVSRSHTVFVLVRELNVIVEKGDP